MDLEFYEKLNKFKTTSDGFSAMSRRIRVNPLIAEYYHQLGEENEDVLIKRGGSYVSMKVIMQRRANRMLRCGRFIETSRFKELGIHEVQTFKLCGDKFCGNCQKQLANARERKYTSLLREFEKCFDIYHITFTVPNVSEMFLPKAVDDIIKSFSRLIKYISGRKRIKGLNFDGYGYVGSIRSLEITQNKDNKSYHPHLHCIFVFRKGLNLDQPKVFTNGFSYSYGRKVQQFSAFEVFIQKLWYQCYAGGRVTKATIEAADGYSCIVNRAGGKYHQIFKYAIKGLLDDKREEMRRCKCNVERNLTFEEFKALYFALENRRAMQGYGCFYGFKFDESVLNEPDVIEGEIRSIIHELRKMEDDEYVSEKLASVIENIVKKNEIYFSRKSIRDNLDSLKSDD